MARFLRSEHYICHRGTQEMSDITALSSFAKLKAEASDLRMPYTKQVAACLQK
jgi:hypothetical protein